MDAAALRAKLRPELASMRDALGDAHSCNERFRDPYPALRRLAEHLKATLDQASKMEWDTLEDAGQ